MPPPPESLVDDMFQIERERERGSERGREQGVNEDTVEIEALLIALCERERERE